MQEWKKGLALLGIVVLLSFIFLPLFEFGIKLQDDEYEKALQRAEMIGIGDIDKLREKPFFPVSRVDAARRYVRLAENLEMIPGNPDDCKFSDVDNFTDQERAAIERACAYDFFKGTDGRFRGEKYVTKANSLVGLMRGIYRGKKFPLTNPYRTPYVDLAYKNGITKRPSGPYMMYLVTRYELLLELWRVVKIKKR